MVTAFRFAVFLAIAALVVLLFVPFEHSVPIDIDLNMPPPTWLILNMIQVATTPVLLVACIGLALFKRWAIYLGVAVSALMAVLQHPNFHPTFFGEIGMPDVALLGIFVLAWLAALVLTQFPEVAAKFSR